MKKTEFLLIKSPNKIVHISVMLILLMFIVVPYSFANNNAVEHVVQQKKVTGAVKDDLGDTLIGVSVSIKGTTTGTLTNIDGEFSIEVPNEDAILVFSYVGHDTHEIKVGNQTELSIVLGAKESVLDEVVVVGYGVQKKKLVTGATVQVKGDNIEKMNTVSALGALQSQSPGVNITQSSGMPGEKHKVVIRGVGTIGNADPLYVIDGSPGGNINNLNPSDIESVDVLKDAASAAIYGSRAANGVIIVTTKTGKKGKPRITFDAYYGVQNVYRMPNILNAQEYASIMNETRLMDNLTPYNFSELVPRWADIENGTWNGTNWLEESRNKDAAIQNYAFGISGGTEQSTYSIGLSYTSQEGVFGRPVQPQYSRYTARLNSEHLLYKQGDLEIIKFGEQITYAFQENNGLAIGDMWSNDIRNLMKAHPFMDVYDPEGGYYGGYSFSIPWEQRAANPIARMDTRSHNANRTHNLKSNFVLTVQPIKNLRFRSNFGFIYSASSYRSFIPEYKLSSVEENDLASVSQSMGNDHAYTWENTLNYTFTLNEKHNFDALIGQGIEKSGMGENLTAANGNPIFNDLKHAYISNAKLTGINAATAMSGSPYQDNKLASFFGRVNYDYDNKYMFTAIMRADASSNFGQGHRWGYFPSFSAGWVVTSEKFMEPLASAMDFLKIRASWGQNGNQAIPPFQYLATYQLGGTGDYFFGTDRGTTTSGAYPDILANRVVTWETSEQTDIGIDARFLHSRLGFTFDYYIKKTKDWLVRAPQLASFGTGAPYINGGDIENKGVEVAFTWDDNVGDFRYGASVNMSYNKNKVTRIANSQGVIEEGESILYQGNSHFIRAQVGFPVGYFYGYKSAGIFQTPEEVANHKAKLPGAREGDVIWQDLDGDGEITTNDRGEIGNPIPDVTMGLNINASYKGFDIGMTFYGAFGHQIMQSFRSWSDLPRDNHVGKVFDRWHGPGTSNKFPRLTTQDHTNWRYVSDLYIEDGDYFRLQNLTVGYDFKHLFPGMFLEQARIYFTAQNLFTITGYSGMDPEIGYGGGNDWGRGIDVGFYPSPRTYMFGVNLKF